MKVCSTAQRLNQIMKARNLRQVDILNAAAPFCQKYGEKLGRNALSQYVSGKVVPGQKKLTILSLALGVSESWLMGYNVPPTPVDGTSYYRILEFLCLREDLTVSELFAQLSLDEDVLIGISRGHDELLTQEMRGKIAGYFNVSPDIFEEGVFSESIPYDIDMEYLRNLFLLDKISKKSPGPDKSEPRDDEEREFIRLVRQLLPEQKAFFLQVLRTAAERAQGKPDADQASVAEKAQEISRQGSPK